MNSLSDSDSCQVCSDRISCTKINQLVRFDYKSHRFNAIDMSSLTDVSENNKIFLNINKDYPMLKNIIIVKHYDDLRISHSSQPEISIFMITFPLKTFLDHL